jgi:hypothetical protein
VPKPRPLSPERARHTLAHRLAPRVDRLRQFATRFGIRPYRVFLTWTRWSGQERGQGSETVIGRIEILPTPKVVSLDNVRAQFFSGGVLPVGSLRLSGISALYTQDQLTGLAVPPDADFIEDNDPPRRRSAAIVSASPKPSLKSLPEPLDFYWEVHEDGRGDDPPQHNKFRLAAWPSREAGNVQWVCMLERISVDELRDGTPVAGFDPD